MTTLEPVASPNELRTYAALCLFGTAVSLETLAEFLNLNRQELHRQLYVLKRQGMIEWNPEAIGSMRTLYKLEIRHD